MRWPWQKHAETKAALTINRDSDRDSQIERWAEDDFVPLGALNRQPRESKLSAVPAADAAINLLTDHLAMLPRRVVDREGMPVENSPVSLLFEMPSRMLNKSQFWELVLRLYIAQGNSHMWIRRHFVTNRPIELVPAYCIRAEWFEGRDHPYQMYNLQLLGWGKTYGYGFSRYVEAHANDVVALHGHGYNGLWSPSPVRRVAEKDLRSMLEITRYYRDTLEGGINSGQALTVDTMKDDGRPVLTVEQYDQIKEILTKEYGESRRKGEIPLIPPGLSITRMQTLSAEDLQLIQLLEWGVLQIARVFNVPPIRLAHYNEGMRAKLLEHQAVDFQRYSIAPHANRIDDELSKKLLFHSDKAMGHRVKSDTDMIAQGSLSERIDAAEKAVTRGGLMTINEGRNLIGLRPHPDGDRLLEPKGAPPQNRNGSGRNMDDEDE